MRLRDALTYEPVELAFGTSGLRGRVRDISHLEAVINTRGFLNFLLAEGRLRPGDAVAIAGDLRPSTTARVPDEADRGGILQAVRHAITASGLRPLHLGFIPSPALMHYALRRGLASVMVTGSHIPFDRNGIKFNRPEGEILKSDEAPILEQVRRVRSEEYDRLAGQSAFGGDGMLRDAQAMALPDPSPDGREAYRARYVQAFPADLLRGRRILVYEHSAVGRDLLVEILRALGADARPAGRSETFVPIDTEAVNEAMLAEIQQLVDDHGGAALEAVVSLDGDSDRPLVLGVDDGRVRFLSGDLLGIVTADYLGARHVAVPISANDAVGRFFGARGIPVEQTRIGSPYVIAAMREVGWEANGGFLTARPLQVPGGGTLEALPTRDAMLPILACLAASLARGRKLTEVFAALPRRYGRSDLLREIPREISVRILERFAPPVPDLLEARVFTGGWSVIKAGDRLAPAPAGAGVRQALEQVRGELERWFTAADGFGRVIRVNYLDGLRIGFDHGDVAHIRPSGNAPELRLYANADTQERADAIVRLGVAGDGVLRRLERRVRCQGEIAAAGARPRLLPLHGVVQSYDWGGFDFIAGLLGRDNPERKPLAELWLGDHPGGPAEVEWEGRRCPLPDLIDAGPEWVLGSEVARRCKGRLPYLFKVLDARRMLSIQVHPSKVQAEAGFARESAAGIDPGSPARSYRDDNHKPEVHVALTEFWMLHGFRSLPDLVPLWDALPELAALVPGLPARAARATGPAAERELLRALYETAMTLPQDRVDALLRPLVARLEAAPPAARRDPGFWILRAAREMPGPDGHLDRGLFSIGLLNLVGLQPGEGTYQPAGLPHAYLEGINVELMARSDNVLRGGLTRKHVDVPELLRTVAFEGGRPVILRGETAAGAERVYRTPAGEFQLSRLELDPVHRFRSGPDHGADCLLVLAGAVTVRSPEGTRTLGRGGAALATAGLDYTLEAESGPAVAFRARVP